MQCKNLCCCIFFVNLFSCYESSLSQSITKNEMKHLGKLKGYNSAVQDANNWHFAMLNDKPRNLAYYRALKASIVPGESVVLDLGTGVSGLLAMMASRLGARKVFTVEENQAIAVIATETFARNGFSQNISLVICSSFDVVIQNHANVSKDQHCSISEPATILVSEIMSTLLTGEGMLRTVEDARDRLCLSTVRVIPESAAVVVSIIQSRELLLSRLVTNWAGFDFRAANILSDTVHGRVIDLSKILDRKYLSEKVAVLEFNFSAPMTRVELQTSILMNATHQGVASFICGWFVANLTPDISINTDPDTQSNNKMRQRHWGQMCTFTMEGGADRPIVGEFHHFASQHITEYRVCRGDQLVVTTSLRSEELKPEPQFKLSFLNRKQHNCRES